MSIRNNPIIECCNCQACFSVEDIEYSFEPIPLNLSKDEFINYVVEESPRIDCPMCGDVMYISDCEIF